MASGISGEEKLLYRYGDSVGYQSISYIYNHVLPKGRRESVQILRKGVWIDSYIRKVKDKQCLTIEFADQSIKPLTVSPDCRIATTLGTIRAKELDRHCELLLDCTITMYSGGREDRMKYSFHTGKLLGALLRYAVMDIDEEFGCVCRFIDTNEVVSKLLKLAHNPIKILTESPKSSYYSECWGKNCSILVLKGRVGEYVDHYRGDFQNEEDFDLSVVIGGANFCAGFLYGYFIKEDSMKHITDIPGEEVLEKLEKVANMTARTFKPSKYDDGSLAVVPMDRKLPEISNISEVYESDDMYEIVVKDYVAPFFTIDRNIIVQAKVA